MAITKGKIIIVGCGPGGKDYLTVAAVTAAKKAEVLAGARRLLDLFPEVKAEKIVLGVNIEEFMDKVAELLKEKQVTVLVSGDPGFYSLAMPLSKRFGRKSCTLISGVSSVQLALARLGLAWQEAKLISAHSQVPKTNTCLRTEEIVAVLAGNAATASWFLQLAESLPEHKIYVCRNLSLVMEEVFQIEAEKLTEEAAKPQTIIVFVSKGLIR